MTLSNGLGWKPILSVTRDEVSRCVISAISAGWKPVPKFIAHYSLLNVVLASSQRLGLDLNP